MNNGDDIEYYLLKGCPVVGVEANTTLCELVRRRFSDAINRGQLNVLNVALSDRVQTEPVTFYLHKTNHVLSQLPCPSDSDLMNFSKVEVLCRTASSIVREFGEPTYIKIDVEHYDAAVLRELFASGVFPEEISAESHSAEIFCMLVANGYSSFNLVHGRSVPKVYKMARVATPDGPRQFSFKAHSSGPFGTDILGGWEGPDSFLYTLAAAGLGWKDIHASKSIAAEPTPSGRILLTRQAMGIARNAARRFLSRMRHPLRAPSRGSRSL